MLLGAGPLADRLEELGGSFVLYTYPGAGHEIAGVYFRRHYAATLEFLRRKRLGASFQEWYGVREYTGGGSNKR